MRIFLKKDIKKYAALSLGMACGLLACGKHAFAESNVNGPGNPNPYNGPDGDAVTNNRSGDFSSIQEIGFEIISLIEEILVPLIMALGLLAFLWGVLQYIKKGGDPKEREQGRQFMLWGIIGLAVMASVWGLVRILTNTIGAPLGVPTLDME